MAGSNRGWASAIGGTASDKATEPRMGMVHARMTALRSIAASPTTNETRQSSSGAAGVQTVRPTRERFYQSLSDEQKARFNAIALADDSRAAGKDQRDLAKFCDQRTPGVTDLPIDRIAQAVQPTPVQQRALDELKDASVRAAEELKVDCPTYQTLTPTGRVQAMEKRLDATLAAAKTIQPPLDKFYNSLNDEQKARFNSLRSASRPRA